MGIGFGPGANLQKAVKKQRSQSKKRSLKDSSGMTMSDDKYEQGVKFKNEATPEQLQELREKLQAEKKKQRKVAIILVSALVIGALAVSFWLRGQWESNF